MGVDVLKQGKAWRWCAWSVVLVVVAVAVVVVVVVWGASRGRI